MSNYIHILNIIAALFNLIVNWRLGNTSAMLAWSVVAIYAYMYHSSTR